MKRIGAVLVFVVAVCVFASMVSAAEYNAMVTLTYIRPIIANRPAEPDPVAFLRVYFDEVTTFGPCRSIAADIQNTSANSHIIATLLTAFAIQKQVSIYVDSTLSANSDGTCGIAHVILWQ